MPVRQNFAKCSAGSVAARDRARLNVQTTILKIDRPLPAAMTPPWAEGASSFAERDFAHARVRLRPLFYYQPSAFSVAITPGICHQHLIGTRARFLLQPSKRPTTIR